MSLVTPDFGLLFWMVIIFGVVFFLLAKFGFPIITGMVDKRNETIGKSLQEAKEIEVKMKEMTLEHERMLEEARSEQRSILAEASAARKEIVGKAREEAREEADKIVSEAREQIAREKETALSDVRREVAILSVSIAEKILRKDLSDPAAQEEYISRLIDEAMSWKRRIES